MPQRNIELLPLNASDLDHVNCMFTVRTHPQVMSRLHGPAPENFQSHIDYLSRVKNKDFFLLKFNGKLCGYCQRTHSDDEIELGWAIHPEYWGQGIGNGSIQELVNQSLHFSKPLVLTVLKSNSVAVKLYQKHHFFIQEEEEETYYKMRYEPVPEISVILSTYNRNRPEGSCPSLFRRAIDSILTQTFTNFELVLIDDASIDGTPDLCKNYAKEDFRIKFIAHQVNTQLPAKCYNEGMKKSRGRFIAFMFDDDVWLPNALQDLHDFFLANLQKNPQLGMVYGLTEFFDIKQNVMIDPAFGREWDLKFLFQHNYLANCAVLIRREVIDVIGGYDEHQSLRRICDWDLWQRIGRRYSVMRLEKLVAKAYHHHNDSLRALMDWDPEKANAYRKLRTHFPLKCKTAPLLQQWNYLKSYFTLYLTYDLTPFFQYSRTGIKKSLQMLGCWNIAKKLYSKLLKPQE